MDDLIQKTNKILKAGRCGLTIEMAEPIPLGYLGNPAGIKRAEADAKKIATQLIQKEFDWRLD